MGIIKALSEKRMKKKIKKAMDGADFFILLHLFEKDVLEYAQEQIELVKEETEAILSGKRYALC